MKYSEARRVVNKLIDDLKDRCGLGDEWYRIDPLIQAEIIEQWIDIMMEAEND